MARGLFMAGGNGNILLLHGRRFQIMAGGIILLLHGRRFQIMAGGQSQPAYKNVGVTYK